MDAKQCPVCGLPMNYNAAGLAKNPKAPHWRCSDNNCKFSWDKVSKSFIPGDFVTAVWDRDAQSSTPQQRFEGQLRETATIQDKKKIEDKREEGMSWGNAKTNAVNIVLKFSTDSEPREFVRQQIVEWANWLHKLEPGMQAEEQINVDTINY